MSFSVSVLFQNSNRDVVKWSSNDEHTQTHNVSGNNLRTRTHSLTHTKEVGSRTTFVRTCSNRFEPKIWPVFRYSKSTYTSIDTKTMVYGMFVTQPGQDDGLGLNGCSDRHSLAMVMMVGSRRRSRPSNTTSQPFELFTRVSFAFAFAFVFVSE